MAVRRTDESQMDFEYNNGHGPVDANSPWTKYSQDRTLQGHTDSLAKKRPYSVLESPLKSSSLFPELRNPASSHNTIFSQPSPTRPASSLPPRMFNNPAFTTPRKPQAEVDTTPESSPDNNADNEATPDATDMGLRSAVSKAVTKFVGNETPNSTASSPGFNFRPQGSPGKGEIARSKYPHAVEKRKPKRRLRDMALFKRKGSSSSDSGGSSTSRKDKKNGKGGSTTSGPGPVGAFFSFLENHPGLPHILSYYTQTLLNLFFVGVIIYAAWAFWSTVQADVREKAAEKAADIMAEMAVCTDNYKKNRCDDTGRAPALHSICDNWKKCMSKDPMAIGWAKVSAHTFAEIYNSFIEPISLKAALFTILIYLGTVAAANIAFSLSRRSSAPAAQGYGQWVPSTPRHGNNGQQLDDMFWQQQQPQQQGYGSPQRSPLRSPQRMGGADYMRAVAMDSPRRQLQYQ